MITAKIELKNGLHRVHLIGAPIYEAMTLDEIEDMESNLTDIILQLKKYRQGHEQE